MDLKHLGGVINTNLTLPIGPLMLNTTLEPWFSLGSIYFGGFEGGVERWGGGRTWPLAIQLVELENSAFLRLVQ